MQVQATNTLLPSWGMLLRKKEPGNGSAATPAVSAANSSTSVTISQAARDFAAQAATGPTSQFRTSMIQAAESDPVFAKKMASIYAHDNSYETTGPLVDISAYPTMKYTYTGEVVTDQNLSEFKAEAAKVTEGRMAIYQNEKARGTPDAQILKKIFSYIDSQPNDYLSKIGWPVS